MAYILQHRRDTIENWESVNPILADAEIGFILDTDETGKQKSSLYKIGDGIHAWNDLPLFGFNGNICDDFDGEDLQVSVASRQAIIDKFVDKSQITDMSVVEGEDYDNNIVSKTALIEKFVTVDEGIQNNLSSIEELQTQVGDLTESIENINQMKPEIEKISELETTVNQHVASISELESDVTILQSAPKQDIMSEEEFKLLDEYEENTLYFTYKE